MASEVECVYRLNTGKKVKCIIVEANSEEAEKTAQAIFKDRTSWTCFKVTPKENLSDMIGSFAGGNDMSGFGKKV